jgi:hypothetical protein
MRQERRPHARLNEIIGVGMSFQVALYDALVSIDVPTDKARAVVDAMEP